MDIEKEVQLDPAHQQKIEELVAIAKEQGYITYEEINEILPITVDTCLLYTSPSPRD